MSSRVFKARTSHTESNPQRCGLTAAHIMEGDLCFYLVCAGTDARPEYQIMVVDEVETVKYGRRSKRKVRESMDGRTFHCVWNGEWEVYKDQDGKTKRRRVYEWQVEDAQGNRFPVEVWSHMVHVSAAEKLGYRIPTNQKGKYQMTTAFQGDRTRGHEHKVSNEAENPLLTLAKASLSDEEAGVVAPKDEEVIA